MLLTDEDQCALRSIAKGLSRSPTEEQVTFDILYNGFSMYGKEKSAAKHPTREVYFQKVAQRLLENIEYAGRTTKQACNLFNLRDILRRIVRSLVRDFEFDVEDVTQDVVLKALRCDWVKRYNPTVSSFRYYLSFMIQRILCSQHSREIRRATNGALRLDGLGEEGQGGGASLFYANDEGSGSLEERLYTAEVLSSWVSFLETKKPFRVKLNRGFPYLCTLLPPGTDELPIDQEATLFWTGGKQYNSRVTTWELHEQGIFPKVPNELLVDYISIDSTTGEKLIIPETGEWALQKNYPNPGYPFNPVREETTFKEMYLFLKEAWTLDEIARYYKVPPTSVPRWVKGLEECFLTFLMVDPLIPEECKHLAVPTWRCPDCKKLWHQRRMVCKRCGCDMGREMSAIRFDAYPWDWPYATRETQKRLGGRREPWKVLRGSVSGVRSW